jgi:nuclear pore complex protein Nup188
MATTTAPDMSYFPSLDKCLTGETQLIGWRLAYTTIRENVDNKNLHDFVNDPETVQCLEYSASWTPKPSSKSAGDFETKTAPINVPQAANIEIDLDELKEDAKWLSKELQIEELSALRLAVLERQTRASVSLVAGRPTVLHNSNGDEGKNSELASPKNAVNQKSRRAALLNIFLVERSHALKLCAHLVARYAVSKGRGLGSRPGAVSDRAAPPVWIDDLGHDLASRLFAGNPINAVANRCAAIVISIESAFSTVEDISTWPKAIIDNELQESFVRAQLFDIIGLLQLLLACLYSLPGAPPHPLVRMWFSLMKKLEFLQNSRPIFTAAGLDVSTAQLLVSLISVEVLRAEDVITVILNAADPDARSPDIRTCIADADCLKSVNDAFKDSASLGLSLAAPALLTWSAVTSVIQEISRLQQDSAAEDTGPSKRSSEADDRDHDALDLERMSEILSRSLPETIDDPSRWFAMAAVDGLGVLSVITMLASTLGALFGSETDSSIAYISKEILFETLKHTVTLVQYGGEILEALLALLTPCGTGDAARLHSEILAGRVLSNNDQLRPAVLEQALARYPYEISPLIRLLSALAGAKNENGKASDLTAISLLDTLQTFTVMVPEEFNSYQLEHENMNSNEMMLTDHLPLFMPRQGSFAWNSSASQLRAITGSESIEKDSTVIVGAGTTGTIVKEPRPFVFRLNHHHSGLEYLGLMLHTFMPNSSQIPAAPGAYLDRVGAAEIIDLFAHLLKAALRDQQDLTDAQHLLGRLSNALPDQFDIVSVIVEIFEAELIGFLDQNPQDGSLELTSACAEFLSALVKLSPERVWSTLARSSLLGVTDGAASLPTVVGVCESQLGRYRFLSTCVELHAGLLEDAISGLVRRKSHMPKAKANRFEDNRELRDSTPERTMSSVLFAFQKILLDVLQNLSEWKFSVPTERSKIVMLITSSFSTLLTCAYGVGRPGQNSLTSSGVLAVAASALRESCAPETGPSPLSDIVARLLPDGLLAVDDTVSTQVQTSVIKQTSSLLEFLNAVIRYAKDIRISYEANGVDRRSDAATSKTTPSAGTRAISLAKALLKNMPVVVALFATDHRLKAEVCHLLAEIVSIIASDEASPPSLLGFMERHTTDQFLSVVTRLDRPLADASCERNMWDFFSAIMSSKQQWFGVFLSSGNLPKIRGKSGEPERLKGKTMLTYALDQLSNIANLAPERALGMLKFLALAQQTLVWSTQQLRNHPEFLRRTVSWLDDLKGVFKEPATSSNAQVRRAEEYEMAAYLCDVLAINVHASLETGNKTILRYLVPRLTFLRDYGVAVDGYNRSLHKNLADNISRRFPNCNIDSFERSTVDPVNYGSDYFYNREFAASVLAFDPSWSGGSGSGSGGFANEFARANINMSLVHAQMQLLRSWKTLTTTLCECADAEPTLHAAAAKVAEKCLLANSQVQLDEPCMAEALELRLELAFIITSRLVALRVNGSFMKELLPAAWELMLRSPVDYEIATASEDVQYYRRLLQVLYLTVQPHAHMASEKADLAGNQDSMDFLPASTSTHLVNIADKIIAPGFRALCGDLHGNIRLALPSDFALLTALLQAIVSVPGIGSIQTLLSDVVAGSSMVRGALSLYSWSDQLAEAMESDPVYGEIAIHFLLALSTIRPIAEQLALDGVLVRLSAANLSNYFRKPSGRGPFDEPVRMYSIWTEGFLPLCLNLLDAVGPPIAAEVAVFLNTFPEQLQRVVKSFDNEQPSTRNPHGGAITLSMVSEAHSLSMIAMIVSSDIARGAAEGINAADIPELAFDLATIRAKVESLWRNKRVLRERITATSGLEARWLRTPSSGAYQNVLESKVMKEIASMLACLGAEVVE